MHHYRWMVTDEKGGRACPKRTFASVTRGEAEGRPFRPARIVHQIYEMRDQRL
jgi:hypothetical protein